MVVDEQNSSLDFKQHTHTCTHAHMDQVPAVWRTFRFLTSRQTNTGFYARIHLFTAAPLPPYALRTTAAPATHHRATPHHALPAYDLPPPPHHAHTPPRRAPHTRTATTAPAPRRTTALCHAAHRTAHATTRTFPAHTLLPAAAPLRTHHLHTFSPNDSTYSAAAHRLMSDKRAT